jgi:membrane associated rhomboid family serine protease
MGFGNLTDVVKNLLILNVIMFIGGSILMNTFGSSGDMLALHYNSSEFPDRYGNYFEPYQIITHMFMHANLTHLFFNMFAVFMFGPILETTWGSKRFLIYYFFTAFGALALHTLVNYLTYNSFQEMPGVLGASGAVFGLLLGFGVYYPNNVIQLLIPPIPIKAKYFVMIYAALELYLGFSNYDTGIAHFAHLGGALFGLIMIWGWRMQGKH